MNRKTVSVVLAIVIAAVMMAACNAGTNDIGTQPTPTASASFMPDDNGNANAGAAADNANVTTGAFDWAGNAPSIEANINQISEISESRVLVADTTALVGVKFAPEYQGELTERIREMIAAEVKKADASIQTVAVTAVAEDVDRVYELSDKVRTGNPLKDMAADINEIVRNATTLR